MLNLGVVGASSASTFSPPVTLAETLIDQSQKIIQDIRDKKTANEIIQALDQFKENIIGSKNADDLGKLKEKIPEMKTAADAWEDTTNHEASAREKKLIESRILGCQFAISQTRLNLGTHDSQDLRDVMVVFQELQKTIDQVSGAGAQFNELTEEFNTLKKEYDALFNKILEDNKTLHETLQNEHKLNFKSSLQQKSPDSAKTWADSLLILPNGINVLCDSIKEIYNLKILKAIILFVNLYHDRQDVYQKLIGCVQAIEFKKEMLPNDADFSPKLGLKRLFYESLSSAIPFSDEYDYEIYVGTIENVPEIKLKTGKNLSIYAHKIIVPEGGMVIEVSGKDGELHASRAKDASSYQENGVVGSPGKPGGNGGNLKLVTAFVEDKNRELPNLTLKLQGGKGGKGQDGGNGYADALQPPPPDAQPGVDKNGPRPPCDGAIQIYEETATENKPWGSMTFSSTMYVYKGASGTNGQNGTYPGHGGPPGSPGKHGIVEVVKLDQNTKLPEDFDEESTNGRGTDGAPGKGQEGGRGGRNRYYLLQQIVGFNANPIAIGWFDADDPMPTSNYANFMPGIGIQYKENNGEQLKIYAESGTPGKDSGANMS